MGERVMVDGGFIARLEQKTRNVTPERLEFELNLARADILVVFVGTIGLIAGEPRTIVVAAGLHLLKGLAASLSKLLWLALTPVTTAVAGAAFLGVRYSLGQLGIVFPFDDFEALELIGQVACFVLFGALVGNAMSHGGALITAFEFELFKLQRRP